jgi:hypothetical protein
MLSGPAKRRRGGAFTGIVAVLALLVALAALFLVIFRDPFSPGFKMVWNPVASPLSRYDLSTAAAAYKSELQIEINRDFRAAMELSQRLREKELKEMLDTLEVKKEVDLKLPERKPGPPVASKEPGKDSKATKASDEKTREMKVLFLTFKKDGKVQHKVQVMERHADSGLWKRSLVSAFEVQGTNDELAKEMREWQARDRGK